MGMPNSYSAMRNNPYRFVDPDGRRDTEVWEPGKHREASKEYEEAFARYQPAPWSIHDDLGILEYIPIFGDIVDGLRTIDHFADGRTKAGLLSLGIFIVGIVPGGDGVKPFAKPLVKEAAEEAAEQAASKIAKKVDGAGHRFEVTSDGVAVPTSPKELESNMCCLTDKSTNPSASRKFVGEDSHGPIRVRIEKAHPDSPDYTGPIDPLHTVDHLHIDRRENGQTGGWFSKEKLPYPWPFGKGH